MRLVAINQSLWLDEAIGALAVRDLSYYDLIFKFLKIDNHPPLYYFILKGWTSLLGYSEFSLRLPSILFGVGTIYLTFIIARKAVGKALSPFPIITAILIATSQFHIYYSQEARMYSMAAFFASLSIYSFLYLIEDGKVSIKYWILYSFSITCLVFTDYMPIFLLPVFWVYAFFRKKGRSWWIRFILSYLPLFAMGMIWLPIFYAQSQGGRWLLEILPAWKGVAGGANFKEAVLVWMKFTLGRISFNNKIFYYSLVVISSLPFAASLINALKKIKGTLLIWLWLVIPLVLGFIISFLFPAFIYFRFLYVIPAFYILVAWGIVNLKNKRLIYLITTILILVNLFSWFLYVKEPFQQREHWREAVGFIENNAKNSDIVIFEYPEPFAPYRWYAKGKVEAMGVTGSIVANTRKTTEITENAIKDRNGIYYFEYLRDLSDPKQVVEKALDNRGFTIENIYDFFPGVGQIKYWVRK